MVPVYRKLRDGGRALPEGLTYVDSWVEPNFGRCFQLMESEEPALFQQWALEWRDHDVTFEFIPVVTSAETLENVAPFIAED